MCFSLYTNGYKILSTKQPPGALTCLNGIRFISMLWVILGHTIGFAIANMSKYRCTPESHFIGALLNDELR